MKWAKATIDHVIHEEEKLIAHLKNGKKLKITKGSETTVRISEEYGEGKILIANIGRLPALYKSYGVQSVELKYPY